MGAGLESLCLVMCDTEGGGRRLILSLFKITSTHWAESLERHCLGFCISLKNIPLQGFPLSAACPFPHSGPLKGSLRGSCAQLLLHQVPESNAPPRRVFLTTVMLHVCVDLTFPTRVLREAVLVPPFTHRKTKILPAEGLDPR